VEEQVLVVNPPRLPELLMQPQLPLQYRAGALTEHNASVLTALRAVPIHAGHARLGDAQYAIRGAVVGGHDECNLIIRIWRLGAFAPASRLVPEPRSFQSTNSMS
jgi:hypothetical protein